MNTNKVAVVTESGNGLGKTFANILLVNAYDVVLAASNESYELLSKEEEVLRDYELVQTDFIFDKSIQELKEKIASEYGKLDLLVNNAEVANGFGQKIDQIDINEVRQAFEIIVFTVIRMVQLFKPLLENSDSPNVINITSSIGCIDKMRDEDFYYSDYYMTGYSCSKAALNMYTHLQSKEFKTSNINISVFDPILPNNCTHNSVVICNGIKDEFISLIKNEPLDIDN